MLSACATLTPAQRDQLQTEAFINTPYCYNARQCEYEWAAARDWVTNNCAMKIQNITDSYIETYNPIDGNPGWACRVTKNPAPNNGYTFEIRIWCANMFGCVPNQAVGVVSFNKAVKAAGTFQ